MSGMDKNFKSRTQHSSTKLTEDNNLSENNSTVASNSESQETSFTLRSAVGDAPPDSSECSKSSSESEIQLDRRFDQFGLWILVLVASFVTSGFIIPWMLPVTVPEITHDSLVFLLGGIACAGNVIALFVWHLLSKNKLHSVLRLSIVIWLPALFSPLFFWNLLCVMPASRIRQSDNGTFVLEYLLYAFGYLVLPALIGSTFALIGLRFQSKFLQRKEEKED